MGWISAGDSVNCRGAIKSDGVVLTGAGGDDVGVMMKRRVALLVFSLAVLGTMLTFWVRSHVLGDNVRWRRSPWQVDAMSVEGLLTLGCGELMSKYNAPEGWKGSFWPFEQRRDYIISAPGIWKDTYAGFLYERHNRRAADSVYDMVGVRIPYWFMALVAGGAAMWNLRSAWLAVRSWRRVKQGRCARCGYDLRATPDRCPECGNEAVHEGCRVGKDSLKPELNGPTRGKYQDVLTDDRTK